MSDDQCAPKLPVEIPPSLQSGPVSLSFSRMVIPSSGDQLVPFYHFKIRDSQLEVIGHINLRVGNTSHVENYAGHLGYEILPVSAGKGTLTMRVWR
jgi:hypothetical protein